VAQIDGALGSAEGLLTGLLDISRLDAGGMTPQVRAFRIDELLQHLAAEFRVLAQDQGLALDCVASRAWVRSDPQLLRRVLQNFLANAVRYTRAGRVLLGCRRADGELRIEVWDTGIGIAESDRAAIFEEFRRLDRGGQGLGLGLSIAERIARLLGHRIGLRSEPGRGYRIHDHRAACRTGGASSRHGARRGAEVRRAVGCWWSTTTCGRVERHAHPALTPGIATSPPPRTWRRRRRLSRDIGPSCCCSTITWVTA
jgi:hypothetical protein